jgi:hypothetical protein
VTQRALSRVCLSLSVTAVVAFTIWLAAALTNNFLYPLSLEATYILVPVAVAASAAVCIHLFALRISRPRRGALYVAALSAAVTFSTSAVLTKNALGSWLPVWVSADVHRNGDQRTRALDGALVVYHLELHNPFASAAKVYLSGTIGGQPFRILLPVGRLTGFGDAAAPSDWITLKPAGRPRLFSGTVTVDPSQTYAITVDLEHYSVVDSH